MGGGWQGGRGITATESGQRARFPRRRWPPGQQRLSPGRAGGTKSTGEAELTSRAPKLASCSIKAAGFVAPLHVAKGHSRVRAMSIQATAMITSLTARASSSRIPPGRPASLPNSSGPPQRADCRRAPRRGSARDTSATGQLANAIKRPGPGRRGPPLANPPWRSITLRRPGCRRPAFAQGLTRCCEGLSVAR